MSENINSTLLVADLLTLLLTFLSYVDLSKIIKCLLGSFLILKQKDVCHITINCLN